MTWPEYAAHLRLLIEKETSGLRLNANRWFSQRAAASHSAINAAFRLGTSGRYQRDFISLWPLFCDRQEFTLCLNRLVERAREIRKLKPFNAIVTSTATSKHILEIIHAAIETPDEPLRVHFVPAVPFLSDDRRSVLSFSGEEVLILTDVVATGTLVARLAEAVEDLGGKVLAALTVVTLDLREIAARNAGKPFEDIPNQEVDLEQMIQDGVPLTFAQGERRIRLFTLANYYVPRITSNDFDPLQVISIDPLTVYPVEPPTSEKDFPSLFTVAEMFAHLEDASAIDFNFYELDGSLFTTAVRLDQLFRHRIASEIWQAINPLIKRPDTQEVTIVTTFNGGDVQFTAFVEDGLKAEGYSSTTFHINRREFSHSTEYFFVPAGNTRAPLLDKHVVLLLSSVQSSQTLRDLVSFLAAQGVYSIRVICLLNRMGNGTREFIARIRRLLRGIPPSTEPAIIDNFEFIAVYRVDELSSSDISRMQGSVVTLLNHYIKETRVPYFRTLAADLARTFNPRQVTAYRFARASQTDLPQPRRFRINLSGDEVLIRTYEGLLAFVASQCLSSRNRQPGHEELFAMIRTSDDQRILFKLFVIVLLDITNLRLNGEFRSLKQLLIERLRFLRATRMQIEDEFSNSTLSPQRSGALISSIELETTLLVGLALISYLDSDSLDNQNAIEEALTSGQAIGELAKRPVNLLLYYGEEKIAWAISLLSRLTIQQLDSSPQGIRFSRLMIARLRDILTLVDENQARLLSTDLPLQQAASAQPDDNASALNLLVTRIGEPRKAALLRKIKDNIDSLLTEFGERDGSRHYQVIRFLHSHLLANPEHHSPIGTSLNLLQTRLDACILQAFQRNVVSNDSSDNMRRISCNVRDVLESLEDAQYACATLQRIAESAERLFRFAFARNEEARRFTEPRSQDSFHSRVRSLTDRINAIKLNRTVSKRDVSHLQTDQRDILDDLFDRKTSALVRTIRKYVTPVKSNLRAAMGEVRNFFEQRNKPWSTVWDRERASLDSQLKSDDNTELYALIDQELLREILKNCCSNVKHAFEQNGRLRVTKNWTNHVECSVSEYSDTLEPGHDPIRRVKVTIRCNIGWRIPTRSFLEDGSTLQQHAHDVEALGGSLVAGSSHHSGVTVVMSELTLISRTDLERRSRVPMTQAGLGISFDSQPA